jgi:hypothetical protein
MTPLLAEDASRLRDCFRVCGGFAPDATLRVFVVHHTPEQLIAEGLIVRAPAPARWGNPGYAPTPLLLAGGERPGSC